MAARAWCTAREAMRLGTKPESALESVIKEAWYTFLLRIRIDDRRRRIGLVFWVQRHRHWTLERAGGYCWERSRWRPHRPVMAWSSGGGGSGSIVEGFMPIRIKRQELLSGDQACSRPFGV